MKKRELYRIIIDGKEVYDGLGQVEYFNRMEDLSIEYYQTGSPSPESITTEIYTD
tara:strand:+ start:2104 stop:2268 length:165 start_codon:yes stop_codon:yes gene_type:complete